MVGLRPMATTLEVLRGRRSSRTAACDAGVFSDTRDGARSGVRSIRPVGTRVGRAEPTTGRVLLRRRKSVAERFETTPAGRGRKDRTAGRTALPQGGGFPGRAWMALTFAITTATLRLDHVPARRLPGCPGPFGRPCRRGSRTFRLPTSSPQQNAPVVGRLDQLASQRVDRSHPLLAVPRVVKTPAPRSIRRNVDLGKPSRCGRHRPGGQPCPVLML